MHGARSGNHVFGLLFDGGLFDKKRGASGADLGGRHKVSLKKGGEICNNNTIPAGNGQVGEKNNIIPAFFFVKLARFGVFLGNFGVFLVHLHTELGKFGV